MRCEKCGKPVVDLGDPQVENLQLGLDGQVNGSIRIATNCSTCGLSQAEFDVEVDVQIPFAHQGTDHDLEIGFEPAFSGSTQAGFPVKVQCSCGALEAKGVMVLRRAN
jgi:hypothetical protein